MMLQLWRVACPCFCEQTLCRYPRSSHHSTGFIWIARLPLLKLRCGGFKKLHDTAYSLLIMGAQNARLLEPGQQATLSACALTLHRVLRCEIESCVGLLSVFSCDLSD